MELTRVLRGAAATLEHTFEVDEDPVDAGTVTVAVTDANGAQVAAGDATPGGGTGEYAFVLAGQPELSLLTVAWSGTVAGAAVTETGTVEVVGGFFFSLRHGRSSDPSLADTTKYPTSELRDKRLQVEQECERICRVAWVPRYRRVVLDGTGTWKILLPDAVVRTVRSAQVAPAAGQPFTALTAGELAALAVDDASAVRRTDGKVWPRGRGNVVVEYEHGHDRPSDDLVQAALLRFRSRLNLARSGIPDRATSFTAADGGHFRLSLPAADRTGIPDVDAVYDRYALHGWPRP